MTDPDLWLDCAKPAPTARELLICFPHAGGSASFFRSWGENLPDYEVYAVRYPGRAERINEPPPDDLVRLAGEIAEAVSGLRDLPIVLFGHSMGAVVAFETARALEAGGRTPAHLFASGSRNAPLPSPDSIQADEDDDAIIDRLVRMGGTDPELAADPIFRELVLPYVRGDGRMFHAYRAAPEPRLRCPVTTIVGDRDVDADRRPWPELTTGEFNEHVVSGNHFYLVDAPPYDLLRRRRPVEAGPAGRSDGTPSAAGTAAARRGGDRR